MIEDGTAKIRTITELSTENNVAAITGVNAGEVVSVTGFDKLLDGLKVHVQSLVPFGNSGSVQDALAKDTGKR